VFGDSVRSAAGEPEIRVALVSGQSLRESLIVEPHRRVSRGRLGRLLGDAGECLVAFGAEPGSFPARPLEHGARAVNSARTVGNGPLAVGADLAAVDDAPV